MSDPLWESSVRKIFQPNENEVVIDVGAHVGTYSIRLAKKAKFVVAIEPHPSTFQVLKYNLKLNKLENALAVNAGIGRENGIMYLKESGEYGRTHLCGKGWNQVKVRSLDSLMKELKIERVDWVKIDTEGMEIDVLYGAKQILAKHNPRVIVEIHKDKQKILKFLKEINYSVKELDINHVLAWKI